MKTEWEKNEPFKRHLEEMNSFRRAHNRLPPVQPVSPDNNFGGSLTVTPHTHDVPVNLFTDAQGRIIVVPIWDVTVPKDSQN